MKGDATKARNRRATRRTLQSNLALPSVKIDWTDRELVSLMKLVGSEPAKATEALIRAAKFELSQLK